MNKAQHVAALFSSQAEMARVLGRHPAIVTRMVKAGRVPGVHNAELTKWAEEHGRLSEMLPYLEELCPCCGKELT